VFSAVIRPVLPFFILPNSFHSALKHTFLCVICKWKQVDCFCRVLPPSHFRSNKLSTVCLKIPHNNIVSKTQISFLFPYINFSIVLLCRRCRHHHSHYQHHTNACHHSNKLLTVPWIYYYYYYCHLYAGRLQLCTRTEPCFKVHKLQLRVFCSCSAWQRVMLFSVTKVLLFYVSTFQSMCAVPCTAVFSSSLMSFFPDMLFRYSLNYFEMVPASLY
jgi:hypothetical protein